MFKRGIAVVLVLILAGCGLAARREYEEKSAAARAQMDADFAQCRALYPSPNTQHIAKNNCDAAAAQAIRPFYPFPDLFDQEWATRALIAEKLQAGKMTVAQANVEASQLHSQLVAEEQRRVSVNRSVSAQELAAVGAYRASQPVSCTRFGNTVNCY